jgi:flagellar biogenesis protein FliO
MPTRAIKPFVAVLLAASFTAAAPRPSVAELKPNAKSARQGDGHDDARTNGDVRQATHTIPVADHAQHRSPKTLKPRGEKPSSNGEQRGGARPMSAASSFLTGLASLAIVLGLFFFAAWVMRRGLALGAAPLPSEVVEVLGRTALVGRQNAHLVRCGNKLLLVFLAAGVAKTLTEIDDPSEVERLTVICRRNRSPGTGPSFRQALQQIGGAKIASAWLGRRAAPPADNAAREEINA